MKSKNSFKLLVFFTLLLSFSTLQAQFSYGQFDDIENLKDTPLLVVLETPNPKKVKKFEKKNPEELKNYLASIEGKNKALKSTFSNAWRISNNIKFVTEEELSTYDMKENHGKYAYLTSEVYDKVKWKDSKSGYIAYTNYAIYMLGDFTPLYSKRYASEYSPKSILDASDMQLAFNQMQSKVEYKEIQLAKREAIRSLKKDIKTAKNTFSDDED